MEVKMREPISPNMTANMNGKVTMLATVGFLAPLASQLFF